MTDAVNPLRLTVEQAVEFGKLHTAMLASMRRVSYANFVCAAGAACQLVASLGILRALWRGGGSAPSWSLVLMWGGLVVLIAGSRVRSVCFERWRVQLGDLKAFWVRIHAANGWPMPAEFLMGEPKP